MPPRFKFSQEEVISCAVALIRAEGAQALTARNLAKHLGATTKPIFSLFESMDALWEQVLREADRQYQQFLRHAIAHSVYPPYKASGMAYIRFAREEKELFKLLFMRDRSGETVPPEDASFAYILPMIQDAVGLTPEEARRFHVESWLFAHGIAAMIATSFLDWDEETVSRALTDAFLGQRLRVAVAAEQAGQLPTGRRE